MLFLVFFSEERFYTNQGREANGNSSIKTESKSQLTLRRRRSFGDFLLHRKKPVINENKERCAETVKPRSWVSYQVKKLVTQLSPSRRRELRHMKSEGSISSLYNAHLEQPIQALSDSLQVCILMLHLS